MDLSKYKVNVPEGQSGEYKIERFKVTPDEAEFGNFINGLKRGGREVEHGIYTKLVKWRNRWDGPIMSDTPAEIKDHLEPIQRAEGNVLITGLGIGMVLQGCLNKKSVKHATVIELSEDVIKLVAPHYQELYGNRLEIIQADALEYKPPRGSKYDMVWHDIWPNICADYLDDIITLKKRYARRSQWVGCWQEDWVRDLARRRY